MPNIESSKNFPKSKNSMGLSLMDLLRRRTDSNYFLVDPQRSYEYLHLDRQDTKFDVDLLIPLGARDWMHYAGHVTGGVSDRPVRSYQEMLFPDVYEQSVYEPGGIYSVENFLKEATKLKDPKNVFGGIEKAFKPGNVILDIASGEAIADMQLALKFPQTVMIGVDILYQSQRKVFLQKPGLQLTNADWRSLDPIPDASVDIILSVQGVTMWGLPADKNESHGGNDIPREDGFKIIQTLNRISKVGTVIRFDGNYKDVFLRKNLGNNWLIDESTDIFTAKRI